MRNNSLTANGWLAPLIRPGKDAGRTVVGQGNDLVALIDDDIIAWVKDGVLWLDTEDPTDDRIIEPPAHVPEAQPSQLREAAQEEGHAARRLLKYGAVHAGDTGLHSTQKGLDAKGTIEKRAFALQYRESGPSKVAAAVTAGSISWTNRLSIVVVSPHSNRMQPNQASYTVSESAAESTVHAQVTQLQTRVRACCLAHTDPQANKTAHARPCRRRAEHPHLQRRLRNQHGCVPLVSEAQRLQL